jgi:uncharacterized protein involved in exopolysaccharide biosynthesis
MVRVLAVAEKGEMDNTPEQAAPSEDLQHLSVGDVAAFLRRRLWVIILVPLVMAGAAVAFSFLQTPVYEASATVLVGQEQGQGDSPARVEELQALIPSAVEIITTRPVAEEVTSGLELAMDPAVVLENLSAHQTIDSGQLIELSYTDTDARRAELRGKGFFETVAKNNGLVVQLGEAEVWVRKGVG